MIPYRPKRILVQEQSWKDNLTREILARLPGIETGTIPDTRIEPVCAGSHNYPKDTLILMRYPGKFLKGCQGSGAEICCNYFTVSYAWNCHFECTYCVLQSYLSNEALLVCTNINDLLLDVQSSLEQSPDRMFRVGTGELADSLALDHVTHFSERLVPLFGELPNGILELKTKSNQISNLQNLDHRGHTVISWSLNSKPMAVSEEGKAASIEERLEAAAQCARWGYKLGFHFDPLIWYEGWEDDYRDVVKDMFRAVNPNSIAWISLGALRFPPRLRESVRKRFPGSRVPCGEFVPGHHGKVRYFRPIREEMYRKMYSWIRTEATNVLVYLCMETRFVWGRTLGDTPSDTSCLSNHLDSRVFQVSEKP
jgi:spore photoproduct lyase